MATVDGSVIVSHSDDSHVRKDPRIVYVAAKDHPAGSKRAIYDSSVFYPRYVGDAFGPDYLPSHGERASEPIGEIPQVRHTYAYHDANYGVINEHNVAIGESSCTAIFRPSSRGGALFHVASLSKVAMERATTARGAVELMGELATKYGYYGQELQLPGEALHVGDKTEAWAFQILPDPSGKSAIWSAKRVPDEHVTIVANAFTIQEVNVSDKANYLASLNLYSVAQDRGWWRPGEKFDFARFYSMNEESGWKYGTGRRLWRAFNLVNPSLKLSPTYGNLKNDDPYPWSVKPATPVSPRDFMRWHRDYFEGTDYDMTKNIAAGFFGSPDQYGLGAIMHPERSLASYRSAFVHVQQTGGRGRFAGVTWFAAGPAHHAAFVPIPSEVNQSIHPLSHFEMKAGSKDSMFWAVSNVMTVCQARFDKMHQVVKERQRRVEDVGEGLLRRSTGKESRDITRMIISHANDVLADWRNLSEELLFRFPANSDLMNDIDNMGFANKRLEWLMWGGNLMNNIDNLGLPDTWLHGLIWRPFFFSVRFGTRDWWLILLGVGVGALLLIAVRLIIKFAGLRSSDGQQTTAAFEHVETGTMYVKIN